MQIAHYGGFGDYILFWREDKIIGKDFVGAIHSFFYTWHATQVTLLDFTLTTSSAISVLSVLFENAVGIRVSIIFDMDFNVHSPCRILSYTIILCKRFL